MLAEQRFELILRELNASRAASVPRLCELTGASEATNPTGSEHPGQTGAAEQGTRRRGADQRRVSG